MYKTKRRLSGSEAGSVEAQSFAGERHFRGSGKAAGFAEAAGFEGAALRGIARADARIAAHRAASKAEHLDIEAARLQTLLREMDTAEEREARTLHELEAEQERLNARTYELDAELRQIQNLLGQTALDLDRAENRITFNREQAAQIESRAATGRRGRAGGTRQVGDMNARRRIKRRCWRYASRRPALEASLRETTEQSLGQRGRTAATIGSAYGRIAADCRAGWWRSRRASRPSPCRQKKRRRGTLLRKSSARPLCAKWNRECSGLLEARAGGGRNI
jgi:hypothetical protein